MLWIIHMAHQFDVESAYLLVARHTCRTIINAQDIGIPWVILCMSVGILSALCFSLTIIEGTQYSLS